MKYCKVSIKKVEEGGITKFSYPEDGEIQDHEVILYEDPFAGSLRPSGNTSTEFAISMVPDDYHFPSGTEELTKTEAESIIDNWIDNDKSILGVLDGSRKENEKTNRKKLASSLESRTFTKEDALKRRRIGKFKKTFLPS